MTDGDDSSRWAAFKREYRQNVRENLAALGGRQAAVNAVVAVVAVVCLFVSFLPFIAAHLAVSGGISEVEALPMVALSVVQATWIFGVVEPALAAAAEL